MTPLSLSKRLAEGGFKPLTLGSIDKNVTTELSWDLKKGYQYHKKAKHCFVLIHFSLHSQTS